MSGEQSAHSAGADRQPAGLRGLRSGRAGSLAGKQGVRKRQDDILKDLHVSGEQSAHSAGEDRQPAGLRGLRPGGSGSLAGIVQGGQKKTTF